QMPQVGFEILSMAEILNLKRFDCPVIDQSQTNPQLIRSRISRAMGRSSFCVREAPVGKVTCISKARATALRASIPMGARVKADIFFSSCAPSLMRRLSDILTQASRH